jgi:plasmid stabilization system protein ParE
MASISSVVWSVEAINNLKEILEYLELKWTPRELKKFAQKLDHQIEIIKFQPLSFPLSKKKNVRRAVMTKQTTIYYEIRGVELQIVSLFDNRKNPKRLKI